MTWPTSPTFMAVKFKSKEYNVQSTSVTGRTQSRGLGGQRWEFSAKYNNMSEADFLPIRAAVMALRGSRNTTTVIIPKLSDQNASSTLSGTTEADGSHSVGDTTILLKTGSGSLAAGSFVKFDGQPKVYMVTVDTTVPGTMTIEPPLVQAVSDGLNLDYFSPEFTVRLANDVQEFSLSIPNIYNFEVDFVEAV